MNITLRTAGLAVMFAGLFSFLAGCKTATYLTVLNEQDRLELQSHNVPRSLYEQMVLRAPVSLGDVVVLSRCGVSEDFIIRYLDTSGRSYHLADKDVQFLEKEGVNRDIINHLKVVHPPFATRVLQGIGSGFTGK